MIQSLKLFKHWATMSPQSSLDTTAAINNNINCCVDIYVWCLSPLLSLVHGYANPTLHVLYLFFFIARTWKTTVATLCFFKYNGCFLCLECWLLTWFLKKKCIKEIMQHSALLHDISIKYTVNVKTLSVLMSGITLFANVYYSLISWPYHMMPAHQMWKTEGFIEMPKTRTELEKHGLHNDSRGSLLGW